MNKKDDAKATLYPISDHDDHVLQDIASIDVQ